MRKSIFMLIAAFTLVFASAFVFRDATDSNVTLSARELEYMTAGQGYDSSLLTSDDIKATWEELKAQYQDSSFAEFFDDYELNGLWGDWTSSSFYNNVKDMFGNLNFEDLMNT